MWIKTALLSVLLFCFCFWAQSQEVSAQATTSAEPLPTDSSASLSTSLQAIDQLLSQLEQNSELSEQESLALVATLTQARSDLEQVSSKLSNSEATVNRIEPLLLEYERTSLMYQRRSKVLGYSTAIEGLVILVLVLAGMIW